MLFRSVQHDLQSSNDEQLNSITKCDNINTTFRFKGLEIEY